MITGVDLVNEQIKIAAGSDLSLHAGGGDLQRPRHRMPHQRRKPGYLPPSPGKIMYYHPPGGLDVRVDSAGYTGYASRRPQLDRQADRARQHRNECLLRLRRSLDEFVIDGIDTTLALYRADPPSRLQNGDYNIHWLEKFLADGGIDGVA